MGTGGYRSSEGVVAEKGSDVNHGEKTVACRKPRERAGICAILVGCFLCGCAGRHLALELNAAVMYEKPRIERVSHAVEDARSEGGTVLVRVNMEGDPGLAATFDISPGIADRQAMNEVADGRYEGEVVLPKDLVGGPFTIIGRLKHVKAGEVTARDAAPLTIELIR